MEAMAVQPKWAESYFGMGEVNARYGRWEQAIQWGEIGIERTKSGDGITEKSNFINANAYNFAPYVWLGQAYVSVGDAEKGLACYEQAIRQRPEPELVYKARHLKATMARLSAIEKGKSLAAHLMLTNEPLKARAVLNNLPAGAAELAPPMGSSVSVPMARMVVEKKLEFLKDPTAYRNFYFGQKESIDALEALPRVKEAYPRMDWVRQRLLKAGVKKVLDLGIGNAVSSFYYAEAGIKVVGVDVDWRRVKDANYNAVKLGYLKAFRPRTGGNGKKNPRMIQMDKDAQVQFHCCAADELSQQVIDLGPYDAVVAAEIIEHVERPEKILEAAEKVSKRIILTTPDASYDGPQEINPSHIRGWSQRELVPLLAERGRIVELHKIPHPVPMDQPQLAAEYVTDQPLGTFSVIIWCFNTGQEWTPESIQKGGIGGSETAVIRVAEELVKRGARVQVFAECEGVWNGVRYAHSADFTPRPCDLFVSWRSLGPVPDMKGLARERWVWSHDLDFGPATAEELVGARVVALSEYQRGYLLEKYPTADIIVSGNGIDPERFEKDVARVPHRLIYAQSPDRGLDVLLRLFPRIRERYADATLEVFYGMDLLDRTGKRDFRRLIEGLAKQPGVTLRGRVDQQTLAEEYLKADALIYPGVQPNGEPFFETYGISIIEAQAAGCIPITPDWGALPEVNACGVVLKDPTPERFVAAAIAVLDGTTPLRADYAMEWARQQTWAAVVDKWLAVLTEKKELVPA
jgi:glycosyltransferase involved in cell wall biosynthesis